MNNKIVAKNSSAVNPYSQITEEAVDRYLLSSNNYNKFRAEQVQLFKQQAVALGLNPLLREIHAVPHKVMVWNPQTRRREHTGEYDLVPVTGYEVYLKRALESGNLVGWSIKINNIQNFVTGKNDLLGEITIHRKDFEVPIVYGVLFSECYKFNNSLWQNWYTMFTKTIIGRGFRLAFAELLKDLPYTREEYWNDMDVDTEAELKSATKRAEQEVHHAVIVPESAPTTQPKPTPGMSSPVITETRNIQDFAQTITGNNVAHGDAFDPNAVTKAQYDLLIKLVESHCVSNTERESLKAALTAGKLDKQGASEIIPYLEKKIQAVKAVEKIIRDQFGASLTLSRFFTKNYFNSIDDTVINQIIKDGKIKSEAIAERISQLTDKFAAENKK